MEDYEKNLAYALKVCDKFYDLVYEKKLFPRLEGIQVRPSRNDAGDIAMVIVSWAQPEGPNHARPTYLAQSFQEFKKDLLLNLADHRKLAEDFANSNPV